MFTAAFANLRVFSGFSKPCTTAAFGLQIWVFRGKFLLLVLLMLRLSVYYSRFQFANLGLEMLPFAKG